MTRIQSSVGLVTGIPIQDTVNQLIEIAARPKNLILERNKLLQAEKLAVARLSSLVLAFQFEANKLGSTTLFESKQVTSSKPAVLSAALAAGGNPTIGEHTFVPIQTASAQQFLSQRFATGAAVGAGSFSIATGGFVEKGITLDELNGGAGIQRGKIRIIDRSGNSAVIDLSFARTVDDVLRAISENTAINVTAVAVGDAFKLIDNTGGSGTLRVQEVAGGTTAASLGLAGISVNADEATGSDVFTLHSGTRLSSLNDGTGVHIRSGVNDLSISFADESSVEVDLADAATLGDVLQKLNEVAPSKLSASLAADGNRIVLTDLTTGSGTFLVANVGDGTTADDLGLNTAASGNTLTGRRLVSGLRDTLISSLRGGRGLGTLGEIDITNRNNESFTVDVSTAETLGEVIAAINAQATGITAAINSARNGIVLTDTTGGSASNFIVADGDATNSATSLGIAADIAGTTVNSGSLQRRTISVATPLSSLNQGTGIAVGDFKITDSAGRTAAVDLNAIGNIATTVGDVIDRINALSNVGVEARINDSGDGIILIDTADGPGTLKVTEVGNGTTARDLRLLGQAVTVEIHGVPTQVIDGTSTLSITTDADDTLADVAEKVNALGLPVTASVLNDGVGQRLLLAATKTGEAHALLIDTLGSPFSLQEVSRPRDALLGYGTAGISGILLSSSSNTFNKAVEGVKLTIQEGTLEPVTVSVASTGAPVVEAVEEFVEAYNSIREALNELTAFDSESKSTGVLFGTSAALRVDSDLTYVLTGRFFGVGAYPSLESIGISLNDKGRMELDTAKLTAAFEADPAALKQLFTHQTSGVVAKLKTRLEQLVGNKYSLLSARSEVLTQIIETNNNRISQWDERLARQRERLLIEFYRIDSIVASMRSNLNALSSLQVLPPLISAQTR